MCMHATNAQWENGNEYVRRHVGQTDIPQDAMHFIETQMPAYLWATWDKRTRCMRAHCTRCGAEDIELPERYDEAYSVGNGYKFRARWAHKSTEKCPECRAEATVMYTRYPHTGLVNELYVSWWRKSEANPNAVLLTGLYTYADWSKTKDGRAPKRKSELFGVIVYEYGDQARRYERYGYAEERAWYKIESIATPRGALNSQVVAIYSSESFTRAIEETPFASVVNGIIDDCYGWDHAREMGHACKWPSLEYVRKMGFTTLTRDILREGTHGAINARGSSAEKVFGLPMCDIKALRRFDPGIGDMMALRALRSYWPSAPIMAYRIGVEGAARLEEALTRAPDALKRDAARYALKQIRSGGVGTLTELRDYWRQLDEMEVPADRSQWLPRDMHAAHEDATRKHVAMKSEAIDIKIAKWAKKLESKYAYVFGGVLMRPVRDMTELIMEGNALCHCVARYADSYADRRTILCVLRREEAPGTPWHTVEFSVNDGRMIQCRGEHNRTKEEDKPTLEAFWAAWNERDKAKVVA